MSSETFTRDIAVLAEEIGPRAACTDGEEIAANYVTDRFHELGYEPMWQTFAAARSAWLPLALSSGLILVASGLLVAVPARWAAAVTATVAIVILTSTIRELRQKPNLLRRLLPKGTSQNVVAIASPRHERKRRILITSHIDTQRTPLAHRSRGWISLFRRLIIAGVGSAALLAGLALVVLIAGPSREIGMTCRWIALLPAGLTMILQLLALQAETTDYSPGACDNASGVAVLLSIAQRLRDEPTSQTEVWLVATGAQEVGNYGASALIADMADELEDAAYLVVDEVGCAGPCYLTEEKRLVTCRYDPSLIAQAQAVAADRPQTAIRPCVYRGTYTEGIVGVAAGMPTLAVIGADLMGWIPHLHRPSDTVENINLDVVRRAELFVWHWLRWYDVRSEDAGPT
ncbi:MAG: M28 family peptidase [Phycisphaerae bacterium]|nr:M28 family peptidase [Phycisphaerae bacterium]